MTDPKGPLNDPKGPLIVALDLSTADAAMVIATQLDPTTCRVKVGKQLFTREGPTLVRRLVEAGFDVFLDLKYHDIPNTVAEAVSAAADLGVWMVNVHGSGGRRMMQAAADVLASKQKAPLLIAVTVLTSMDTADLRDLGILQSPAERVLALGTLARECGLDGVVCSAQEAGDIRAQLGQDFLRVTPGIRLAGDGADDQRRVVTPVAAVAGGSSYLVMGRSITSAAVPADAVTRILASLRDNQS